MVLGWVLYGDDETERTEVTVSRIEDGALERSGEAEVGPLPPRPWHLRHGHTGSQNTGVTLCYRGWSWSLFTMQ